MSEDAIVRRRLCPSRRFAARENCAVQQSICPFQLQPELARVGSKLVGVVGRELGGRGPAALLRRHERIPLIAVMLTQAIAFETMIDQLRIDRVEPDRLLQCVSGTAIEVADPVRRSREELVRPALKLVQRRERRLKAGERRTLVCAEHLKAATSNATSIR
jgi:hypothetical protein